METIPLYFLFLILIFLFFLSAFFSGSETALMVVNRYRLTHLASKGHKGAKRVLKLLENPKQLIALILLGNNFINIIIAQLVAYIGYRLHGEIGIAIATAVLTLLLLIFAELTPKTIAAMRPQQIAFAAGLIYTLLRKPLLPFTYFTTSMTNILLKIMRISDKKPLVDSLNREELRSALNISKQIIPYDYHGMLVGVLDLESKTIEDIMVTRNEIVGLDFDRPYQEIEDSINNHNLYTRMPVFHGSIDNIIGILHIRNALQSLQTNNENMFDLEKLKQHIRTPYFVSKYTRLIDALRGFKQNKRRMGLVVDEYGTIQGLVTLEDLLEEIVGEFTNDPGTYDLEIKKQSDGSVLVDGSCHIREINQLLGWKLDENGPKTINGLLLDEFEMIPNNPSSIMISGHPFEVIRTQKNAIKLVKIMPKITSAE